MDATNFAVMKSLDLPLLLSVISTTDTSSADAFASAGQLLSTKFVFGISHDPSLVVGESAKPPFLTVFNKWDETRPVYRGPFETAKLLDFAQKVSSPLIERLDLPNLAKYMKVG